jgi:hypothetical protein
MMLWPMYPPFLTLSAANTMMSDRDTARLTPSKRPDTLLKIAPRFSYAVESPGSWVTVGEFGSAEICVSHIPSLKAKKLRKLPREKVLLEL